MVAGAGLLAANACAPAGLAPAGIPTAAPAAVPNAAVSAPARRIVTPATATHYHLATDAVIVTRADTMERTDTVQTHTALQVTPRGAAYDIVLDSHVVHAGAAPPLRVASGARAIVRTVPAGGWEFVGAGLDACTALVRSAFEATRDLWIRWPDSARAGTGWSDSTTTTVCRDGIPLAVTLVRQYRVTQLPEDPLAPLVVARTSQLSLTGHGALRGDTTLITGSGTSDAVLYVRPHVGWLDSATVSGVLRLDVRGTSRSQAVEQRTQGEVRRTPDTP